MSDNATPSVETWLKDWLFRRHTGLTIAPDANLFQTGMIDSYDVIVLIEEVERAFEIRFSDQDFLDARFSTLEGLNRMILEKRQCG